MSVKYTKILISIMRRNTVGLYVYYVHKSVVAAYFIILNYYLSTDHDLDDGLTREHDDQAKCSMSKHTHTQRE